MDERLIVDVHTALNDVLDPSATMLKPNVAAVECSSCGLNRGSRGG